MGISALALGAASLADPGLLQYLAQALAGGGQADAAPDMQVAGAEPRTLFPPQPANPPPSNPLAAGLARPFLPPSLAPQGEPPPDLLPVPLTGPYGAPAVTRDGPRSEIAMPSQDQVASNDGMVPGGAGPQGAPPQDQGEADNPYTATLRFQHEQANSTYDRAVAMARQAAAAGRDPSPFIEAATAANKVAEQISKEGREYLKSKLPKDLPQTLHEGEALRNPQTGAWEVPIPKTDTAPQSVREFEYAQTHPGYNDFRMEKTLAGKGGIMAANGKPPDENLSGFDYLAQFDKNKQASVMSLLNGEAMPSGRLSADRQSVHDIASRVGQDIGEPMDDASFAARRKMLTDLSSSSPASLGGQNKAAGTAIRHANAVNDILLKLHSAPGGGGIGSTYIAEGLNRMAGLKGDPNRSADLTALDSQLVGLGQEMTKMFAGSPGAEAERLDPLRQFPRYGTPQEQAGYIDTQMNRILARVRENEQQTHTVLGPRLAGKHPALDPEVQKMVAEDIPSKSAELYKRSQSGAFLGGPSERPPPTESLPPTLGGTQPQQAPSGPQPGFVKGGYRFKGGDPSQKGNWEPAP